MSHRPDEPATAAADALARGGEALDRLIVDVPDFPEPGIVFKDITPVLADPSALAAVVAALAAAGRDPQGEVVVDRVVGMEARGFILGPPVALALGVGFAPVRKAGKLPRPAHGVTYSLEYGEATLELHHDAVAAGERVLVVDDVLATGGTARATRELVERCGGVVAAVAVLLELTFLPGRAALPGVPVTALRPV